MTMPMRSWVEVYPAGTRVRVDEELTATVVAVLVEGDRVTYKLRWATSTDIKEGWAEASLVKSAEEGRVRIGFHHEDNLQ